jgi:hypothetical protein
MAGGHRGNKGAKGACYRLAFEGDRVNVLSMSEAGMGQVKYCVYWWHETSMNCIKVGYSKISHLTNPESRARAYAFKYQQLDFELASLRVHPMRSLQAALYVEYHLLRWLNETCVNMEMDGLGRSVSKELFGIHCDYRTADIQLLDQLQKIVAKMPSDEGIRAEYRAEFAARQAAIDEAVARGDLPF